LENHIISYPNMKISGIGSLFASSAPQVAPTQSPSPVAPIRETQAVNPEGDAVVLSQQMQEQSRKSAAADTQRREKLDRIREAVKNNSYETDSKKVAESVIRDLM
jgi:anti-sigma28 factor (negative regulator of flagellin synthesis)